MKLSNGFVNGNNKCTGKKTKVNCKMLMICIDSSKRNEVIFPIMIQIDKLTLVRAYDMY